MSSFATRFAPSPTGHLHKGHAFSALSAFSAARAAGGRFLLRIEDIDVVRSRPEYEAGIIEDLAWLGLEWEQPVRRQSEHMADYLAALERLRAQGLLYRDFRSRKEQVQGAASAPHALDPRPSSPGPLLADEERRQIAEGRLYAWRLSLAAARARLGSAYDALSFTEEGRGPSGQHGRLAADPDASGDIILARKDVGVAYHLAVVIDDALQGISHVIRGQDLFHAAGVQRLLQTLLQLPEPVYRHHRLLTAPDGRRFAKRDQGETLRELRRHGLTAQALREQLGFA